MTHEELTECLGDGGTGVISFSRVDEPPFSISVSYGYDENSGHFYYRLSLLPNSEKVEILESLVTFVVHRQTEKEWRSVVASGELERVADSPYESTAVQGMWAVQVPKVDIFDHPPADIDFLMFRLSPERLTGRKEIDLQ